MQNAQRNISTGGANTSVGARAEGTLSSVEDALQDLSAAVDALRSVTQDMLGALGTPEPTDQDVAECNSPCFNRFDGIAKQVEGLTVEVHSARHRVERVLRMLGAG